MSYVVKHTPGPWRVMVVRGAAGRYWSVEAAESPSFDQKIATVKTEMDAVAVAALPPLIEALAVLRDAASRCLTQGALDRQRLQLAILRATATLTAAGVEIRDAPPPHSILTKGGEL